MIALNDWNHRHIYAEWVRRKLSHLKGKKGKKNQFAYLLKGVCQLLCTKFFVVIDLGLGLLSRALEVIYERPRYKINTFLNDFWTTLFILAIRTWCWRVLCYLLTMREKYVAIYWWAFEQVGVTQLVVSKLKITWLHN